MCPSHVEILRAARKLTGADSFVADWRADHSRPGCHVGFGPVGNTIVVADGESREAVLEQLTRPLSLAPAIDAIGRALLAARRVS